MDVSLRRAPRRARSLAVALPLLLAALASPPAARDGAAATANALFGAVDGPAPAGEPKVIGTYTRGCIKGAVPLPTDGPGWQVMRLSRNRNWGHPNLVEFVEKLAADTRREGWPGLLIGDMAQPRGGPMSHGHASHQLGLDVDIWLKPMPERTLSGDERETLKAVSVLKEGKVEVDPRLWSLNQTALIRRAALYPGVERIFVNPGIKKALCATTARDNRAWLAKVRPWYGHDAHFHVRLRCPAGQPDCRPQREPGKGDGCGGELADWLKKGAWRPPERSTPARPVSLAELPKGCRAVLQAP
jgi:penicillin-insensitive murein DD-endopeptidase